MHHHKGPCDNLVCALKLLADVQIGVGLVDSIFEGLQERSRYKVTDELRRFILVDNHEVVRIGELEQGSEAMRVVRPNSEKETFPNAAIREGTDELTLRVEEAGVQRTFIKTEVGDSRWGPPLTDEE